MGVAQNFYYGTRLEMIVLALVVVHRLLLARSEVMAVARYLPLTLIGFLVGWGPGIRVPLYHRSDYEARLAVIGIFQSGWFRARERLGESPYEIVAQQLGNAAGAVTSVADRSPFYLSGMPLLDTVSSILFAIGLALTLYRWRSIESALLVAWLVVALVGGGFLLVNAPESHHFVTLAPLLCLLIGLGIDLLTRSVERTGVGARLRPPALAALAVGALVAWNLHFYFASYTPRHVYGFRETESSTAIGRYLATRHAEFVYFVGAPYTFLANGSIAFLARSPEGVDVPQPIGSDGLPPPPPGVRPIVVVAPARIGELASVRRRYPGTSVRKFRSEVDGVLLFATYSPNEKNWPA